MPFSFNYEPPKPYREQCRHILTSGHRCQSPCLKARRAAGDPETHEPFCYFHHTTRRPVSDLKARRARQSVFEMPLIEDRSAIQASIGEILSRIASNDLDPRRAGLLLYGLQIASLNLPPHETRTPSAKRSGYATPDPIPTVVEITDDPTLGVLAPVAQYTEPGDPGPDHRSLGRRLSDELDRIQREAAARIAAAKAKREAEEAAEEAAKASQEAESNSESVAFEPAPAEFAGSPADPTRTLEAGTAADAAEPQTLVVSGPEPHSCATSESTPLPPASHPNSPPDSQPKNQLEDRDHSATVPRLEAVAHSKDPELPLDPAPSEADQPHRRPRPRTHRPPGPSNPRNSAPRSPSAPKPSHGRPSHKTQRPNLPSSRWPFHR